MHFGSESVGQVTQGVGAFHVPAAEVEEKESPPGLGMLRAEYVERVKKIASPAKQSTAGTATAGNQQATATSATAEPHTAATVGADATSAESSTSSMPVDVQ